MFLHSGLAVVVNRCFALMLSFLFVTCLPLGAVNADKALSVSERLARGEVVVGLRNVGAIKYVTGTILIDQPPEHIWPIMTNPYEFQGKISPRMKEIEVMVDKEDESVMKVHLDIGFFIPHFTYVVDSLYHRNERIDFKRVGGTLKDFSGSWEMAPSHDHKQTELTYCMYVDPGFYVPQWIVREGVKRELPDMLTGLRKRVFAVFHESAALEPRSILASRPLHHTKPVHTASSNNHHLD